MKKINLLVFITLFNLGSTIAFAYQPPTDNSVNKIVTLAIHPDFVNALENNRGSVNCEPLFEPFVWDGYQVKASPTRLQASGKSVEFAQTFSQLKCIKEACELLPLSVNIKAQELSTDEKKVRDILQESGLTEEQIKTVLGKTKNSVGTMLSCSTNQNMRNIAYDICITIPYQCD